MVTLTGNNSYNVTVSSDDATSATAAQLNAINDATSVAVDLSNVTAIAASSLNDLNILQTAINGNEFSNSSGLTTIAVSDTSVDATLLDTVIERFDFINGLSTTNMTLASGATINVDAAEVASLLADEAAGRLTINNQSIIVNGEIPAIFAVSLSDTTSGLVTATIEEKSLVDLAVLPPSNNAFTISIEDSAVDVIQLISLDSATSLPINGSGIGLIQGDFSFLYHLYRGLGSEAFSGIDAANLEVTGDLDVTFANLLDDLTTGSISGSITSEDIDTLKLLNGDNNSYSITISESDATSSTAADLNAINTLTTVAVNLTNVRALAASSLSDLGTLANAITNNEFSNDTGLTTIAVSDTIIDATTVDSYDTINGGSTTV